ncbi:MAG: helix-turn-helix domain-containing protein [Bacteroidales bacterium]|nr:helix-turn-helix domain-containing protein [Bacteroidales bacterium]
MKKGRQILTQAEFGEVVGLQPAQISDMLKGKRPITEKTINKILVKFPDIDPDWLLNGQGEMKRMVVKAGKVRVSGHHNEVNGIGEINGLKYVDQSSMQEDVVGILKMVLAELAEQRKMTQKFQEKIDRYLKKLSDKL